MNRRFLLSTIACFILFASLHSFSRGINSAGIVQDVLSQTNNFRRSKGLPALIMRNELNSIAQKHSTNMARGSVGFGHEGFAKRNAQASRKISHLRSFGENVAYGATSGNAVVKMWKNSPGHRRNMLGAFKYIGIGVAKDRRGILYYTQVFAG